MWLGGALCHSILLAHQVGLYCLRPDPSCLQAGSKPGVADFCSKHYYLLLLVLLPLVSQKYNKAIAAIWLHFANSWGFFSYCFHGPRDLVHTFLWVLSTLFLYLWKLFFVFLFFKLSCFPSSESSPPSPTSAPGCQRGIFVPVSLLTKSFHFFVCLKLCCEVSCFLKDSCCFLFIICSLFSLC